VDAAISPNPAPESEARIETLETHKEILKTAIRRLEGSASGDSDAIGCGECG
jgi:hypothetical protein